MAHLHDEVCWTHNTDYCPEGTCSIAGSSYRRSNLPLAVLYMLKFHNGKRWFPVMLSIHVTEKPRSAWGTSGSVSFSFYHLKLKATHKETLMKAVSPTAYNERMNYGAMATQSSSCCCRTECELTWYSRKGRQVWSTDPCQILKQSVQL